MKNFIGNIPSNGNKSKHRWDQVYPEVEVNINVKGSYSQEGHNNQTRSNARKRGERKVRWGAFLWYTLLIVALIILFSMAEYETEALKKTSWAFFTLLLFGWILAMFDLPHIGGPTAWIEALFRPFGRFMEK